MSNDTLPVTTPGTSNGESTGTDRRGLTGSARLMQDIVKLEQFAFTTDRRKQQITRTILLSQLDPVGFQKFKETGVFSFSTTQEMFDRDFPGHYMRIIKRLKTSVIALIPPSQGIKASLSSRGISRVIIGGDLFQEVIIRRNPEIVYLSSPINATGLFELESTQHSDFMLPFEGSGVDMAWEFRMPKASNPFDYGTIADVILTLEYTSFYDFSYYEEVIQRLGTRTEGDRIFSFRNQFSDQWYDLHNPQYTDRPMIVTFETLQSDFPANVLKDSLEVQNLIMYFSLSTGLNYEIPAILYFTDIDGIKFGGPAQTQGRLISTLGTSGSKWNAIQGLIPIGKWQLDLTGILTDYRAIREAFENKEVQDIIFVISYNGRLPEWPK